MERHHPRLTAPASVQAGESGNLQIYIFVLVTCVLCMVLFSRPVLVRKDNDLSRQQVVAASRIADQIVEELSMGETPVDVASLEEYDDVILRDPDCGTAFRSMVTLYRGKNRGRGCLFVSVSWDANGDEQRVYRQKEIEITAGTAQAMDILPAGASVASGTPLTEAR